MNTSKEEGTPLTIDAAGNIVPRPNGYSRWASPKRYECTHKDCDNAAVVLSPGGNMAHNCCAQHGKEWGLE
jgi:hypothetical protein